MDGGSPGLLRFEVLGPLRARRGGAPLDLGPVKRQAVLAALLLRQGAVVSHDQLLDSVWGSEPPAGGRKVLPTHVNSLRRALDPEGTQPTESVIRSGKGWYRFVAEGVRLDTADLAERADEALHTLASGDLATATDQFAAAVALFRGEPLANLTGPFAQGERRRLLERRRMLRQERLKCLLLLRRFGDALDDFDGLSAPSAADLYDESLVALRMRALYGCGRPAEALQVYEEMRRRLRDELGTSPREELRRVHEAVLRQDDTYLLPPPPPPAPPPKPRESNATTSAAPAELPHDAAGFAGRTDELARLHRLLPSEREQGPAGTVVISAIGGAAGIGKTALAVHWAHQVRDRFPDGQLYINLHGFDHDRSPLEPGEALELLLRSLGLAASEIPANHEAQGRVFRTLLADRRMLVLLDNAASAEQVRPLLPGSATCCVVVTSRNRLGDLIARDGAHALRLDLLQPDEARALLSRALGADRVDADDIAVSELIRLCGSLPLALRVAAARLAGDPALRTADLVAEMTEGNRLEALEPDGDASSPLRTAFSVSYRVLAPGARRLFRLLGLFPGAEFTVEAAAALLDVSLSQARRLLGALAAAHLIEAPTAGRYRFHDLLREYAQERAQVEETVADRDAALKRVLLRYLHTTRAAAGTWHFPELPGDLASGDQAGSLSATEAGRWLEAERANLLAVINHAAHYGPRPVAWHLVSALFGYFWLHLPRATWQALARTALDAAVAEGDLFGQAAMHHSLAVIQWDWGHVREAAGHNARELDISRELDWRTGKAGALGVGGFLEWSMARLDRAHESLTAGLLITSETGNRYLEAFGLNGLGMVSRDLGRLRDAADHLELVIRRNAGISWWDDSMALQILGWVYWELGRLSDGLHVLRPKVATDDRGGYRNGRAMMLDAVAKINVELGHHDEALAQTDRALAMVRDLGRPWIQSSILNTVAAAHRRLAHFDRALDADTQALALAQKARFRRAEADSVLGLSLTHQRLGHRDEARSHAEQALSLAREYGFGVVEGQALTVLCRTAEAGSADAAAAAVALGREALAVHRETGHRLGEARTLMALARAHRKTDPAAAEPMKRQARDIFSDVGVPETEYEDLDR
ncbi:MULTISPECIES: BTAD domain-containing putative transcriptional regulator [unclassified Streptomyces]|uniref:AfsR/SARP family transcriptional regulator n=1 Tax=unclassified Streptomyces TaxID=2593676 RepID=UPI00236529B8|nr:MULTISPECIES: BTAD domain-containing putative transcriptional regulator [unclassified Streptomyces]MDF3139979.1 BTAD domain-containing putative transcriptional regulator [Streptomyces sp. T21Q-yed]WDF39882.1 BTAD domain-containing putative transcriptional regulator [Streptomyces sp. T12]